MKNTLEANVKSVLEKTYPFKVVSVDLVREAANGWEALFTSQSSNGVSVVEASYNGSELNFDVIAKPSKKMDSIGIPTPASAVVASLDAPATDFDEALLNGEGLTLDAKADDERLVLLAVKSIYEQSNWEVLGIRNLVVTLGESLSVEVVIENEDTKDRVIVAGDYDATGNQWTDRLLSESKADEALDLDAWRVDAGKGKSRGKRTTAPKCNKGRPCGMSCISQKRNCRMNPQGAAEEALKTVVSGGGSSGGSQGGNPVYKWHSATSENFEIVGSRKTLKNNLGESIEKGSVFYNDPNATEDQRAYMRFRGQNYIRPYVASAKEFQELFGNRLPDVAKQARAIGIEGETDIELAVRWATLGANRSRGAEAIAESNLVPIEWTDAPKGNTKSQKKKDSAPTSIRFDRAPLANTERLPDGRLRVRATFSRVGPLNYLRADGTMQTEIVTADELFREDSLETAGLAPVTLGHPPDGMVTPKTWKKYAVGASGSTVIANRVDGLVDVVFVIGDEEAIEAVESGRATEVSAGYSTLVESRGDGKFYQTNRQYNHLAIVERGRAGPGVRLHLDAAEDWAVMADEDEPAIVDEDEPTFVIDEADLYLTNDAKADDERFVLLAAKTIYEQSNWEVVEIRDLVIDLGRGLTVTVVVENEDNGDRLTMAARYVLATNQWSSDVIEESKNDEWREDAGKKGGKRGKRTTAPKCSQQACGMSCISRSKTCHQKPAGAAQEALKQVVTGKGGSSGGSQKGNASRPEFEVVGDPAKLPKGTVFWENATPQQREWMERVGQNYMKPLIASRAEIKELFPDIAATAKLARSQGYKGKSNVEVAARYTATGIGLPEINFWPIRWDANEQRGDPSVVVETFDTVNTDSKGGCDCMPGMKRYKGMDMEEEVFDAFKAMEGELETLKKDMKGMIPKKDSAYEEKVDALAGENAGLRTRVAALEAELGTRMDASAVEKAAQARLDAYMECLPLLPKGVRFDATLSPIEWRKAAIAAANPSVDLEGRSDDFVNGMFSTMQVVTAKAEAKVDAAKSEGFRRILDSAAVAGHSGSSTESPKDLAARQDADDIEAINKIFAFNGGAN